MDDRHIITADEYRDDSDLKKYRTEIPNMICDIGLTPYEIALYVHLKRVCGARRDGRCFKSTRTLARETGMSVGRVSEARAELERRGLIAVAQPGGRGKSVSVSIVDIWSENMRRYALSDTVHNMNTRSRGEHHRSRGEPKKEPYKKEHKEEALSETEKKRIETYRWFLE